MPSTLASFDVHHEDAQRCFSQCHHWYIFPKQSVDQSLSFLVSCIALSNLKVRILIAHGGRHEFVTFGKYLNAKYM